MMHALLHREANAEITWLRGLNAQLVAVLDSIGDAVIVSDAEGHIAFLNRKARDEARAIGYRPDEDILGKTIHELPGPALLTADLARFLDEVRERGEHSHERLAQARDGARWREDKGSVVRAPDGRFQGIVLVSRDVHERKLVEARGRVMARITCLPRSTDPGPPLAEIARSVVPDLADWAMVALDLADPALGDLGARLARGEPALVAAPDGRAFLENGVRSLVAVPLILDDQPVAAFILGMTDRSGRSFRPDDVEVVAGLVQRVQYLVEKVRLGEALAKSEARFRVALMHSNISVFEHRDREDICWVYNPHFGRRAQAVDGNVGTELPPDAVLPGVETLAARVLASGVRVQEELAVDVGGELRHLLVNVEPLVEAGVVVGVSGAAVDMTEVKRAQQELAQALGFRERLLSVLGHDLNNPLSAVRGLTSVLQRRAELGPGTREVLAQIEMAARRMTEMIETLLDFSRTRFQGGLFLKRRWTDLHDVCAGVIDELQAARPGRTVSLAMSGEARGEWDSGRIAQAVSNLVANALTHGAQDRPVEVAIEDLGDAVLLKVTNQGPPIPRHLIPSLFDAFQRGQATEAAGVPGLGLGLYIVKQIALGHGGSVAAESSADGTTFTLRLPRHA